MKTPIEPFGFILKDGHEYHLKHGRANHLLFTALEIYQPHKNVAANKSMTPLYTKEDVSTILKEAVRRIEVMKTFWGDFSAQAGATDAISVINTMVGENEISITIGDDK